MSSYYLRYTADAQGDLKCGVSFAGYMMYETQEEAIEEHGDCDESLIVFEDRCGMWGRAHSGLCGFGPFFSVEEAEAAIDRNGQYAGAGSVPAAIFEGVDSFDFDIDGYDEGPFFTPVAVVKIVTSY